MIIKKSVFILSVFLSVSLFSQKVFIPYNIQQAINSRTRTDNGIPGINYFQNYADYKINARFNPATGELTGRANITYYNNSEDTLNSIVLRLYQNIFKTNASRDEMIDEKNLSAGMIISDLFVNGFSITDEMGRYTRLEGTNYRIILKDHLMPHDSCKINIAWNFTMPHSSAHRFGKYAESTFFVAMWYPQIAVYDDIDGWDGMQYNGTQEFYNDFNNYDVTIAVPSGIMLWAAGTWENAGKILTPSIYERYVEAGKSNDVQNIIRQEDIDKHNVITNRKSSFHYKAYNIPDFVFAVSNHYLWDATSVIVDSINNRRVLVSAAYPKESSNFSKVASICSEIVRRLSYESYTIPFPYPAITVFNGEGGMEYPMMVNNRNMININSTTFLTLHEVAHTYFPFLTGINERKYSWMDEGLTSYLPMTTQKAMNSDYNSMSYFVAKYEGMCGSEYDIPLNIPAYQTKEASYYFYSYYRPTMAFSMLENLMGKDTFKLAIQRFIQTWQGLHPTPYDLFGTFKNSGIKEVEWLFDLWFFQPGYPDLSIANVRNDNENIILDIRKIGNLPVPVQLSFIYEDGDTMKVERNICVWKDKEIIHIVQPLRNGLKKIVLGNYTIPDRNRKDNSYTF